MICMREFAEKFYKSKAWKNCREAYAKSVRFLCEECLKKGLYVPGEIVHHKIELQPWNINDPDITLSWSNLELVCRECHGIKHGKKKSRYKVNEQGQVISVGN